MDIWGTTEDEDGESGRMEVDEDDGYLGDEMGLYDSDD